MPEISSENVHESSRKCVLCYVLIVRIVYSRSRVLSADSVDSFVSLMDLPNRYRQMQEICMQSLCEHYINVPSATIYAKHAPPQLFAPK